MNIYDEYSWDTIEPVMRPGRRVLMAVPTSIKSKYYRLVKQEKDPRIVDSWFLPDEDKQWDILKPWADMPRTWRLSSAIKLNLRALFHK